MENSAPSPHHPVRNIIGWRQHLSRLQGLPLDFDLRGYDASVAAVARLGEALQPLGDDEIARRAALIRASLSGPGSPDDVSHSLREEFFALVREASRRTLGLRPFDVQVLAAIALDGGHIVEMQTGEGKTLAAVMPAALRALAGRGAHVLTFNDYLARRDAEWMGPSTAMLGLSVGFVQQGMTPERTPSRLPRRRHLRDRQRGGIRSSARSAGDRSAGRSCTGRSISRSSTKPTRS